MKSIAIITDSKNKTKEKNNIAEFLKQNILEVFRDIIHVNNYFIDALTPSTVINDDLVIVMAGSRAIKIKDYVTNQSRIIVANRTFFKSSIKKIFSIPDNSDVLVVNINFEAVLETVSSLYNIGIKHINLIPFEAGKNYEHIHYAISPSEPTFVPTYITNVYDIGLRVIDISTMLQIISELNLNDKNTQQKLFNYYNSVFSSNDGVLNSYNNLLARTEEIDFLLNLSHDGILLTDQEGKILVSNKKFKEIFSINAVIINKYLHDVLCDIDISKYYQDDFHDDLITYNKRYLNLEKKDIVYFNQEIRMYFSFQEVTYIKKLEQNLSQKLRQKGQIARYSFDDIISTSKSMETVINSTKKIAKTDLTVFITGESGTGKEVLAQAIHNASERHKQPFIAINGSAIPDNLLESELFGYVGGSFTGALKGGKKGLFEKANNGTIFLDEIGDMPNHLQSKLLRVLQERQITPIGSDSIIDIDVRVIAATHKDPFEMIQAGNFRTDLFYRLNVFPVHLPPLRDRLDDISELLHAFTHNSFTFSKDCIALLNRHDWPGNIRELNNVAQYISILEENSVVHVDALPIYLTSRVSKSKSHSPSRLTKEKFLLAQKVEVASAIGVLNAIQLLNRIKKTAGRKHLLDVLEKKGLALSEDKLRKILFELKNNKLIVTLKGRKGSYITELGYAFIAEHE